MMKKRMRMMMKTTVTKVMTVTKLMTKLMIKMMIKMMKAKLIGKKTKTTCWRATRHQLDDSILLYTYIKKNFSFSSIL